MRSPAHAWASRQPQEEGSLCLCRHGNVLRVTRTVAGARVCVCACVSGLPYVRISGLVRTYVRTYFLEIRTLAAGRTLGRHALKCERVPQLEWLDSVAMV
jgi:hypothetical protein